MRAAGDWEACGDRFYEKHELYVMAWSGVRLEHMRYPYLPQPALGAACMLTQYITMYTTRPVQVQRKVVSACSS